MKTVVSSVQAKELDQYAIEEMKMPSLVLMERAALAVVDALEKKAETLKCVLVVCGTGNNGADGVAVGRILHLKGYDVNVCCLGEEQRYSPELRQQLEIAKKYCVSLVNNPSWNEYTTIVDAIFGVGLSRNVTGFYLEAIKQINQTFARKVAVDVPSGLCSDSGRILGHAVRADETVTFAFLKKGLCFYPGCEWAGETCVADIGIYERKNETPEAYTHAVEWQDVRCLLPKRAENGNKGSFGKVLFLAGSRQMAGAAYLCASACLRSGAGMVKIHTAQENREILQTLLPEALLSTYAEGQADFQMLKEDLEWCDVVAAGPGLGQGPQECSLLQFLLENCAKPLVLDADALNLFGKNPHWAKKLPKTCVFTPHLMEMSRMTGKTLEEIQREPFHSADEFAKRHQVVCVLKDARTVIAVPDGRSWVNLSGNSGMATAGSGDVLTGITAALLAVGEDPAHMAALAVYLHGCAGDMACGRKGDRSMTAQDIIGALPEVFKRGVDKNGEKQSNKGIYIAGRDCAKF